MTTRATMTGRPELDLGIRWTNLGGHVQTGQFLDCRFRRGQDETFGESP
jgi:hypothetical protein